MTRTNNLSNTQFRYQIVFFIHIYGYVWLAEGCHWHLLPRQNFTTSLWTHISLNICRSSIKLIFLESEKQGLSFAIQQSNIGPHLGFQLELGDIPQI